MVTVDKWHKSVCVTTSSNLHHVYVQILRLLFMAEKKTICFKLNDLSQKCLINGVKSFGYGDFDADLVYFHNQIY